MEAGYQPLSARGSGAAARSGDGHGAGFSWLVAGVFSVTIGMPPSSGE
jgi:hypothetical protein